MIQAALANVNRPPRFRGALGAAIEHVAEPVEGAGVKEGAGTAFAVLPGAFGGTEAGEPLGAGEGVVELLGVDAEVVAFGCADEGGALDAVLEPFQRVPRGDMRIDR